jgi:iron only hydrogenase large subunit-like protein
MNLLSPIFTAKGQCQDCYKCVRHCPVKAIKIEAGCATVIAEQCIFCGNCVMVCPSGAKKIRDDLPPTRQMIAAGRRVVVSLAPSWVSAFPNVPAGRMIAAIERLGVFGVSETALGAQQVSAHVARMLHDGRGRVMISSACPTVVKFLQLHRREHARHLTPLLSPMLTHGRMLKGLYGEDTAVVFIGPCIAKKLESDEHPELVSIALTFDDLRAWFRQENIDLDLVEPTGRERFLPERASDGAIYAIDGGMIAGVKSNAPVTDCALMAFSGISSIGKALNGLEHLQVDQNMLIELLACEGGCINGPCMGRSGSTIARRYQMLSGSAYSSAVLPRKPTVSADAALPAIAVPDSGPSESQIRQALHQVGKFSIDDELNCGGCGYDSCRDFGRALVASKAERAQCVTYMRQLAHKKANALIQKMPSAVVIVDDQMKIVEHNDAFARLFPMQSQKPLEGTPLSQVVSFHRFFNSVLKSGQDLVDKDLRHGHAVLHVSIFTIEKHALVGGIIQDITRPAVQKEQVIRKAQEVIRSNLATVQQIACLLGENASESEITLNSIIDSFGPPTPDKAEEPPPPAPPSNSDDWRTNYRR